jgi:REP element-mobilizing transposase RayT
MSSGIYNQHTGYRNHKSIRLPRYDYSQPGYYFVTICIHDRKQNLFGNFPIPVGAGSKPALFVNAKSAPLLNTPSNPMVIPNQYQEIVQNTWNDLTNHIPNIVLDEFIIMPNHIHGIIRIIETLANRAGLEPAPTVALPEIIRQLKTFSAKRINKLRNTIGQSVWQRNYYEHIIRDEKSLFFIRKYIRENPVKWLNDSENHIEHEIFEFQLTEIGAIK